MALDTGEMSGTCVGEETEGTHHCS